MKARSPRRCLSIGTSDSSGGAGIQGDVKTFASLGCHGMTAVVGVTAQNTLGVTGRFGVPPDVVAEQIAAVVEDIGVDAVKVAASWSRPVVEAIAAALEPVPVPIVVDPVFVTAAGSMLADPAEVVETVIGRLFPLATVVTPNLREAQLLTGLEHTVDTGTLTEALTGLGAKAVVVTRGDGPAEGDRYRDTARSVLIHGSWHTTGTVHGSGCAHSSALTAFLAYGLPTFEAACRARRVASEAVRRGWSCTDHGPGPVDPLGWRSFVPDLDSAVTGAG